jgi:hypothetical protein
MALCGINLSTPELSKTETQLLAERNLMIYELKNHFGISMMSLEQSQD